MVRSTGLLSLESIVSEFHAAREVLQWKMREEILQKIGMWISLWKTPVAPTQYGFEVLSDELVLSQTLPPLQQG